MDDPFFDSNIVIDWLNRRPEAKAELARYSRHRISRIAWTEILAGEPLESRDRVRDLLSGLEVVELDVQIATTAAEIRFASRLKLIDAFILATAQVHGAILVTRNTKDFPAGTPGVRVPYTI